MFSVISGDDSPSVVIPNVVGTTRSGTETYVGQEALDNKLVYLTHPMRRGYVTDLEAMQVTYITLDYVLSCPPPIRVFMSQFTN